MSLAHDLAESRKHEMKVYLSSLQGLYQKAFRMNGEIYDRAEELTGKFVKITGDSILADSRIIKILRYAVSPSISQMKFGQFFGLKSTKQFEESRLCMGTESYRTLKAIADEMASFVTENIDRDRFIWIDGESEGGGLAREYAKKWTCSLAADQNAQTAYRNWRKDRQEQAIADEMRALGYVKSSYSGVIESNTDISVGQFTQELKVKGRTRQKADLALRRSDGKLALIEAKAVGVELDSTKRIKECCDKSNDWRSAADLDDPMIIAVIAGFFTKTGISNLRASSVNVVWEHRLSDLKALVSQTA